MIDRKQETFEIYKIADVRNMPSSFWRWRNFSPLELCSPDNFSLILDVDAVDNLQMLRNKLGVPLIINSAYRSRAYNMKVGGVENSYHRKGRAFDIRITQEFYPYQLVYQARLCGFYGIGLYDTFIHIDTGIERVWDNRKFKNAYHVNLRNIYD